MIVTCPYCHQPAQLVSGDVVYPYLPHLSCQKFYICTPCDARVGCHDGTTKPLGRLANAELRQAKQDAHAAFDPLWKSRYMMRRAAYAWLAEQLGIEVKRCHIGWMDVQQCKRVVEISNARRQQIITSETI